MSLADGTTRTDSGADAKMGRQCTGHFGVGALGVSEATHGCVAAVSIAG